VMESTEGTRAVHVVDRFAKEARALRAHFDERFADPRAATAGRFVWDYWNVPGQYTALRTPAWTYFPTELYESFHRRLVAWGRRNLGCHDISPPWMSCYIEGCVQHLHGDLPHGPWAFVLSLTDWESRVFRGGETLLVRDEVLEFWSRFVSVRSVEEGDVLRAIEPKFNRLTVFDPRIPHGVREVRGTHDPREGRLVIHGWFVQPRPCIEGPLSIRQLATRTASLEDVVARALGSGLDVAGLLSLRIRVAASGAVTGVKVLSDTTRVVVADEPHRRRLVKALRDAVRGWSFRPQSGPSEVTLPLVFERSNAG
jgi:hypothetical protein